MAIALLTLPSKAQVTGPTTPSRPLVRPIQINVEMVLVNVAVTDFEDRLVLGLHKDSFRLFENETEQEILDLFAGRLADVDWAALRPEHEHDRQDR